MSSALLKLSRALHALLRRDLLTPAARLQVFAALAEHFRALVAFPQEATDGVSDEQYVRNVVDVLFHASHSATATARSL